jgi:hypothetical protein
MDALRTAPGTGRPLWTTGTGRAHQLPSPYPCPHLTVRPVQIPPMLLMRAGVLISHGHRAAFVPPPTQPSALRDRPRRRAGRRALVPAVVRIVRAFHLQHGAAQRARPAGGGRRVPGDLDQGIPEAPHAARPGGVPGLAVSHRRADLHRRGPAAVATSSWSRDPRDGAGIRTLARGQCRGPGAGATGVGGAGHAAAAPNTWRSTCAR